MSRDRAPITLGGRKYVCQVEEINWRTVEVTRRGVDQGAGVGESSLSNEQVWRRTRESWELGAGQEFADIPDESDVLRFRESHNCNPWTRRSLTILKDTERKRSSANTNLKLLNIANTHLYIADGSALRYTTDPTGAAPTFTDPTGYGGGTILDMTSDGSRIYVCDGTGVWRGAAGAALTSFTTEDCDIVGYANGRLLAADANELFELDSNGTAIALFTHPNPNFVWRGIVPSPGNIYAFGDTGTISEVYAISVVDATGGLDVPFHALPMPDGEAVRAMCFYGGVMVMATSRGIRLALITGGGFLSIGPVIPIAGDSTTTGVECLEPEAEDVWFGWADATHVNLTQTAAHSCIGRLRLARFTEELVPAYAEDLVANNAGVVTGRVQSVVSFGSRRYFAIRASGFYGEKTTYAASGQLDTGWFTWSTPEDKQPDHLRLDHDSLVASETGIVGIAVTAAGTTAATATATNGTVKTTGYVAASTPLPTERVRVRITLTSADGSDTPTLRRITVAASPVPFISDEIILPLILTDTANDDEGAAWTQNVMTEWNFLVGLRNTQERTSLVFGAKTYTIKVAELAVVNGGLGGGNGLQGWNDVREWPEGTWLCRVVTMDD